MSQLSASFRIDKGQAVTTDLNLIGPLVRVTGAGTIALDTKMMGFRVEPKLVMTTEGQGRANEPVGFGIPVMIQGPWSQPKIYPDMAGMLDNPDAAYAKLREMGKGLFGPDGAGLGGLWAAADRRRIHRRQRHAAGNADPQAQQRAERSARRQLGEAIGNLLQQGLARRGKQDRRRARQRPQPQPAGVAVHTGTAGRRQRLRPSTTRRSRSRTVSQ